MDLFKWNLNELFASPEDFYACIEEVKNALPTFNSEIEELAKSDLTPQKFLSILKKSTLLREKAYKAWCYGSLVYYKDVKNPECLKMKKDGESINSEIEKSATALERLIVGMGEDRVGDFISRTEDLVEYKHYFDDIFRKSKHIPNAEDSAEIQRCTARINELNAEYNALIKGMDLGSVLIDGEETEITATNIARLLASSDRETRRCTYLSVNRAYRDKENDFARILDEIYDLRLKICKLQDYSSMLEKSLYEENIPASIITSLISSVHDNLGHLWKYLSLKISGLKIEEPHMYDYSVPVSSDFKVSYPIEDTIDILKGALAPLGEKYVETVLTLIRNGHIDAEPDEKKHQAITFSWMSYSFMNYKSGSYADLKNVAHEIGHDVNDVYSLVSQLFIYFLSTNFCGETASISNEILLNDYLFKSSMSEDEKLFYLMKSIENYISSIYRPTMYTEFEQILCSEKEKGRTLTGEFITATYRELLERYYGDMPTYDEETPYEWMRIGHIYRWQFYHYQYATGLLIASIVVKHIREGILSVEDYIEFLSSGCKDYSLELLKILGIDFESADVISEGFGLLEAKMSEFERIMTAKNVKMKKLVNIQSPESN